MDVKVSLITSPDILAAFEPTLRHFLFTDAKEVRYPLMDALKWKGEVGKLEGEISGEAFEDVRVKKFEISPRVDRGTEIVAMTFSMSFKPEARQAAVIAELIGERVYITLKRHELDLEAAA